MAAVVAALVAVNVVLAVLVVGLLRSHADVLRALHDLGVDPTGSSSHQPGRFGPTTAATSAGGGTGATSPAAVTGAPGAQPDTSALPPAVDIDGTTARGDATHVAVTDVDHLTLLAFLTTGCELCLGFWEALADPAQRARLGDDVRIVAVTQGGQSEMPSAVDRLAPRDLTTIMSPAAWDAYQVPVAPFFAMVDGRTGRVVGEGAAPSWDQLVDLLGRTVADGATPARRSGKRSAAVARRRWADREADTDDELRAAGLEPGDPRLHHPPVET